MMIATANNIHWVQDLPSQTCLPLIINVCLIFPPFPASFISNGWCEPREAAAVGHSPSWSQRGKPGWDILSSAHLPIPRGTGVVRAVSPPARGSQPLPLQVGGVQQGGMEGTKGKKLAVEILIPKGDRVFLHNSPSAGAAWDCKPLACFSPSSWLHRTLQQPYCACTWEWWGGVTSHMGHTWASRFYWCRTVVLKPRPAGQIQPPPGHVICPAGLSSSENLAAGEWWHCSLLSISGSIRSPVG